MDTPLRLVEIFENVADWRSAKQTRHKLSELLTVAVCAMISGADDFEGIAFWGECKLDWLRTFMPLENGIPSPDTFARVFSLLDPKVYEETFRELVAAHVPALRDEQVVALDGKTSRRSTNKDDGSPLHMISAFAADVGFVLGQTATDSKSNEITALPRLIRALDIKNCILTLDAMGTQKNIAQLIREKGAHYILCVKDNHPKLAESIRHVASNPKLQASTYFEHIETNRGRHEERRCWAYSNIEALSGHAAWQDIASFAIVERTRTIKGQTSCEQHLYISSLPADAERIAHSIRKHWQIENRLHWCLDVCFAEDYARARTGHAANNLAITRHIILNLLRRFELPKRTSLKNKRMFAASSDEARAQVLRL